MLLPAQLTEALGKMWLRSTLVPEIFGRHKELECQNFHLSWDKPSVADHSSLLPAPIPMERGIYTNLIFEHTQIFELWLMMCQRDTTTQNQPKTSWMWGMLCCLQEPAPEGCATRTATLCCEHPPHHQCLHWAESELGDRAWLYSKTCMS